MTFFDLGATDELDWDGLHDAAFELLADSGPLELARIVLELRDAGHNIPADAVVGVDEGLLNDRRLYDLRDGRYCVVQALVEGKWFAHWVTSEEAADGVLPAFPDFVALSLVGERWRLEDGQPLEIDHRAWENPRIGLHHRIRDEPALIGPPGWLTGRAGDVVAVRVNGASAEVRFVDHEAADPSGRDVAATRWAFDRAARWEGVASLYDVVMGILVGENAPFGDEPRCLDELLVCARLSAHGEHVLWADLSFDVYELAEARAALDTYEIRERPKFHPTAEEMAQWWAEAENRHRAEG